MDPQTPSFQECLEDIDLLVSESGEHGYGLFTKKFIRKGVSIVACWSDAMLTMPEYIDQVVKFRRHPHEFLANMPHNQSETLDLNNADVLWCDLVLMHSPILFLNGASNHENVNVGIEIRPGWAYRDVSFVYALVDIEKGSELLDAYML